MIEAPVKLPVRMAGKNIKEHLKINPEATEEELSVKFGCSKEYARQIVLQVFPEKNKWPKSRRKKYAAVGKRKAQAKTKAKSEKFPRKHSGRKHPLDNVLEIDAHRSAARMEGKFMAIETILSEGLEDIGKTIGSIDKMPENRQRLKELLRGALLIAESMEPPAEQNTQREGHASVNATVNLTKIK